MMEIHVLHKRILITEHQHDKPFILHKSDKPFNFNTKSEIPFILHKRDKPFTFHKRVTNPLSNIEE